ncbi:hypothetical protein B879_02769 [Cecembia lonarensis LW9]|uniref:Glycosyl transferase family 1 domain-containing protein n=2 Tax=Cecembia TaxID=1187078 RepID=K1L1H7_CECL9|nr:hypothetical protein B879_02769 [Cecembia lonarensis LW9]
MSEFSILYFAFVGNHFGGVEQKIMGQFDALVKIHPQTYLYLVSTDAPNDALNKEIHARENIYSLVNTIKKNPFKRRREKFSMIEKELQKYSPKDTVIYFRYPNADFLFLKFLKNISEYKIITEHQEIENTFLKGKFNGNYLRNFFELIWGKAVRNHISGFVGVTEEISNFQTRINGRQFKPSISIGNPININAYPLRSPSNDDVKRINILFVGSGFKTHGLFRLITSIAKYKEAISEKGFNLKVKVVGNSAEMSFNKNLVLKYQLEDIFEFCGFKTKNELNKLFDWADIGVGSLGLHRIGLNESSTLKAREYVCRGLPFFWSTRDIDISNECDFIHSVEPNDKEFDILGVINFAIKMKADNSIRFNMRQHASTYLSNEVKMKNLFQFLNKQMSND